LLLLAECWAAGGEITDFDLSRVALDHFLALAIGKNTFLAEQAINLLAGILIPEAKTALASLIRDSNGHFAKGSASRFAISVFGEAILPEVVAELVRTGK
jgi:hypothetical protein